MIKILKDIFSDISRIFKNIYKIIVNIILIILMLLLSPFTFLIKKIFRKKINTYLEKKKLLKKELYINEIHKNTIKI